MKSLGKWAVVKFLMRIAFFVSILFILWVSRELFLWYQYFSGISEYIGIAYIVVISVALVYFVIVPVISILLLPSFGLPESSQAPQVRMRALRRRARILQIKRTLLKGRSIAEIESIIHAEVVKRSVEAETVRNNYVTAAFIGTAVSQSAVVDLFIVLSCGFKVMLKTLRTYGGRASLKDTFLILREIMISGALGASEVAEISGDALAQLTTKTLSKIPGLNLIIESLSDGMVNAYLVCRVAMITENYCTIALIDEKQIWLPSVKAIKGTLQSILIGSSDLIKDKLGRLSAFVLSKI